MRTVTLLSYDCRHVLLAWQHCMAIQRRTSRPTLGPGEPATKIFFMVKRSPGATRSAGRRNLQDRHAMMVTLPPDYRPSDAEDFMNPLQVAYFRQKLLRWRSELLRDADGTLAILSEGVIHAADITDRSSVATDRALELRTRDRARKLTSKIDQALTRIDCRT